ncbi:MAG: proton-conducting transporter membrane subunit [Armatimonadota bacterium]
MLAATQLSVQLIFGLLLAGALAGIILGRWARLCGWVCSVAVAGALGASAWLGTLAWHNSPVGVTFGSVGPAPIAFEFTRLNLIFVWLVLGLGLLATVHSVRYIEHSARGEGVPAAPVMRYYPLLMLFLGSMAAVVCMPNLLSFFIAWSIMSLSGLALILHEYHKPDVLAAGIKFAVFTLVGNTAIFIAIMILRNASGSFSLEAAQDVMSGMFAGGSWMPHLIFGLFAFGFLTKLGIYPMGDWLPDAHPAAPSPVSALLSGVMIKLAAYDVAHMSIELMVDGGASPDAMIAWGLILGVMGGLSVLLGGAAAAANNDTKRLLAYSSVSQSGYILMCLGVSMAFVLLDLRLAGLAFVAALVFVIADGMHKSLLFLTAGSILHATGTRDLVQLGGLGDRMPSTKLAAIAGGLSLGGIPLTAGFIAKWLLLQAALQGSAEQPLLAVFMLVVVLGSILAMAYALKYVGAAFLGHPADPECCAQTEEVPGSMRVPQFALVAGLVVAGLWPALMAGPAAAAWSGMMGIGTPLTGVEGGLLLIGGPGEGLVGGFVPVVIFVLVAVAALVAWGLSRLGGAPTRDVPSWQSGLDIPLATTRLPASGWFWPFTPVLRRIYPEIKLPAILNPVGEDTSQKAEEDSERDAARAALGAADGGE